MIPSICTPPGLTPPLDPAENGFLARASAGDLIYFGGTAAGQITQWDGAAWGVAALGLGVLHSSAAGVVTSSSIVNADVSAVAAIAGTKISPNFGAQNITTTGNLILGTTPALTGLIRMPHNTQIMGRNSANTLDRGLLNWGVVASNTLVLGDSIVTSTRLQAASSIVFQIGSPAYLTITSGGLAIDNTAVNPTLIQANDTSAGATGDTLSIRAQAATGTGTVAGGPLIIAAGNAGTGVTTNATGGSMEVAAGDANNATATNIAGNITVRAGRGVGVGGVDGNIALHVRFADLATLNFQSMQRGIFIANSTAVPAGNPTGGGFLYVSGGALIYRGSAGSITTLGAA